MMKENLFTYQPCDYFYQCEELSDRAIPFLLFNLLIRGMNAVVIHGDALERKVKQIYFIQNDSNDFLNFSSLNVMPHNDTVAEYFKITEWTEEQVEHVESSSNMIEGVLNE